jgi:hypothetical protein
VLAITEFSKNSQFCKQALIIKSNSRCELLSDRVAEFFQQFGNSAKIPAGEPEPREAFFEYSVKCHQESETKITLFLTCIIDDLWLSLVYSLTRS